MRRILVCLALFFIACAAKAETLVISAESYPPYSFKDANGNVTGVYMEQLAILLDKAGVDYSVTIMPWARAIALTETQPMHCVFGTARTKEREDRFKWVEPMHMDRNVLVARKQSGVKATNLDEAKAYIIGTQRNDYTETILRDLGFPRIDLSADFNISLNKLIAGRIDLMPMSESTLYKLSSPKTELVEVTTLTEQRLGLACHKTVSDKIIALMQKHLDDLIADGTQKSIFEKYGLIIRN
jgi:polar amino acid transport system substrate-binding protein